MPRLMNSSMGTRTTATPRIDATLEVRYAISGISSLEGFRPPLRSRGGGSEAAGGVVQRVNDD